MQRFLFIATAILLVFVVDWYVFQAIRTVTQHISPRSQKIIFIIYWCFFLLTSGTIIFFSLTRGTPPTAFRTYLVSTVFILFASKLAVVLFLVLDDAMRLMKYIASYFFNGPDTETSEAVKITRSEFINKLALMAGAIPLTAFIYGMVRGAYQYQVKRVTLRFPNLPDAFSGYKILQISDLHTGSFNSTHPLQKAVALINKQNADLVFFTGDLVNNIASEVVPHIPALQQIQAKDGKFSIFGNHDYGDYVTWESGEAKTQNLQTLAKHHAEIGWRLLLNENVAIQRNGQHIAVLGVENWSTRMNFPRYGNLAKAYAGSEQSPFKVLLSHDPSHWDGEVNQKYSDIDLMLSGHTHGMQFGINLPGIKWSPVQYVYEQWAGLYQKGMQHLYVNTGLGFLGYPGRVGFLPEITVFELQKT
ncbi:metallophosphoesterase [Adhaeribacter pallidiroseus]|uniref:Putative metallophosphoesterase YkuE n=1 Tax=Adhaeribacter pallidiroseus TaxID=2072847 RepID=A0A369QAD9_9BACT|nr:metallophosphoesterase [Adhaeribacter pallidiroseus]RDC61873.1 putative metallophosphoesterase YkuE [Adhaeribacter pallidiroseus]